MEGIKRWQQNIKRVSLWLAGAKLRFDWESEAENILESTAQVIGANTMTVWRTNTAVEFPGRDKVTTHMQLVVTFVC